MIRTFQRNFDRPRVAYMWRKVKATQGYNTVVFPRRVTENGVEKRVMCVLWSQGFFNLHNVISA